MFLKQKENFRAIIARITNKNTDCHISLSARMGTCVRLEGKNWVCEGTRLDNVKLGKGSYVSSNGHLSNAQIGKYCSIGPRCIVESAGDHPTSVFVSTHPSFYSKNVNIGFSYTERDQFNPFRYIDPSKRIMVEIGNDVWVASDVKIMPGVTIGDGAIIAAGAIVTKDVPPYAIVGGVPAKIIRYRFAREQIEWLKELKWWDKDEQWIKAHAKYFDNIEHFAEIVNRENNDHEKA